MGVNRERVRIDTDNPSIQRIESRCINCGMCMNTCENIVGINHKYERDDIALCINCGQCIMNCPVGALCTKYDYKKVLNILHDTDKCVTLSVAPAVRVSLASEFGLEDGTNLEGLLPSIARALGFDYVFDITFGADVTIMEEAQEFVTRLKSKENLPLYTSCCPSWVKYASMFHKELLPNLSTTKSPIGIQSTLIKTYFKEFNNIDKDIISVVVAPCTSKKYEIKDTDTDYIITTQELAMMIRECRIDINALKNQDFDALLSKGSKSGLIFGRSGGVMSSVLACAHHIITGTDLDQKSFFIKPNDAITEKTIYLGSQKINIAIIYGMKNLEDYLQSEHDADIVEVMNCPEGCIGGGGQPLIQIQKIKENRENRINALNSIDATCSYAYENNDIKELYRTYLDEPLSKKALALLHKEHLDLSHLIKK